MTDVSPGSDWWQASDGKWYPPHLHPDVLNAASESEPSGGADSLGSADMFGEPDASASIDTVDSVASDEATASVDAADSVDASGFQGDEPVTSQPVTSLPPYIPPEVPAHEPIDWERVAAERDARRRSEESSHRRRVAGAVLIGLGALAIFVWAATNRGDDDRSALEPQPTTTTVASSGDDTTTTTTPATTTSGAPGVTSVSVFDLQPGMCINNAELSTGLVTDLSAVPCDQPHSHEVYHKVTFNPPDGAFDATRVAAFADEQCSAAFATYVGIPYDQSRYYFLHLAPSAESWKEQGDRDVVCLLFQQGATLTGSAQGSAQ